MTKIAETINKNAQRACSLGFAAIILCAMILVAGCVNPPIAGRADPYAPPQISFADAGLANQTAVDAPIVTRANGDLLYVTVPIRSTTNQNLHVDYRVTFLDAAGQPIEQRSWMGGVTLEANTPTLIKVNSTSANARDFQIAFRWSR